MLFPIEKKPWISLQSKFEIADFAIGYCESDDDAPVLSNDYDSVTEMWYS